MISSYTFTYNTKEIDVIVDNPSSENDLNEEENEGISQQNIYFFIIGALLASICCVCMIGTSLGIIYYIKRRRKIKGKRQKKLGWNYVDSSSKKEHRANMLKLRNNGLYQQDCSPSSDDKYNDHKYNTQSHDVDVIYESEENENDDDDIVDNIDDGLDDEEEEKHQEHMNEILNDKDSNEKSYNTESEEEGALDQQIFDQPIYIGIRINKICEGGTDKDIVDVINRKQTEEEKFAGMLNDAKVVNDIMLNDVIDEMETAGMEKQAENSHYDSDDDGDDNDNKTENGDKQKQELDKP